MKLNKDGSTTYTNKEGKSVTYNKDGYSDFTPYAHPTVKPVKIEVAYPENRKQDFRRANEEVKLNKDSDPSVPKSDEPPDGYTWHHHEDGTTMILVEKDIHADFSHTGGVS
ncbi:HNH endonuclease, partial [Paenibacillus plantiphilus]|uniref:HNH endonuclease n=1 Tax=Paenibacillus plantiphilus TaxID=2905650 RepID=UPI001F258206